MVEINSTLWTGVVLGKFVWFGLGHLEFIPSFIHLGSNHQLVEAGSTECVLTECSFGLNNNIINSVMTNDQ